MILSFVLFIVLLFTGIPLYANLGLSSILFIFMGGFNPLTAIQKMTMSVNSFTMVAAPFFIIMGNIFNNSGVTKRIFTFANVLVGHLPGGLGHANVVGSVIFAGMSGNAVADAGGLGNIEIQAMKEAGYEPEFACAVTVSSALISPIIPPSFPMVLLAVVAEASLGRMFLGGIVPGLLMGITLCLMVAIYAKKRNYPRSPVPTLKVAWAAFKEAIWALLAPLILLVGMFSGMFTTTEAAIVAAFYSLFLGLFVYKELDFKDIPKALLSTADTNGVCAGLTMAAGLFGWMMTVSQVPQEMAALLVSITSNKILQLLIINIFLLFVGMVMDLGASVLILGPVLIPMMQTIGVDITQACLILVLNLVIGLATPPVGIVLSVTSNVSGIPFERVTKATMPFLIPLFIVLMLVTYVPAITTFIPNLVFGH
jgi:tripartite ATP-independent transporter DctM subunit